MNEKEELLFKAELCHNAALRVRGEMRTIWMQKRNKLREMAEALPDEAGEINAERK